MKKGNEEVFKTVIYYFDLIHRSLSQYKERIFTDEAKEQNNE